MTRRHEPLPAEGVDELLRRMAQALERLEIAYFVTGSVASTFYGEPRFTNHIDLVVDLRPDQIARFVAAFPSEEFYLDEERVRHAVGRRSQFNILHPRSGLKVDVMLPEPSAFERSRFARVRPQTLAPDLTVPFASPEDVILKKLVFHHQGGSDKHLRDISAMAEIAGEALDRDYLRTWTRRLDIDDVWESILERVGGRGIFNRCQTAEQTGEPTGGS